MCFDLSSPERNSWASTVKECFAWNFLCIFILRFMVMFYWFFHVPHACFNPVMAVFSSLWRRHPCKGHPTCKEISPFFFNMVLINCWYSNSNLYFLKCVHRSQTNYITLHTYQSMLSNLQQIGYWLLWTLRQISRRLQKEQI